MCCGTKRLVEIACPSDCGYLASAREHPPAVVIRRQQDDLSTIVRAARDLSERQSRLLFVLLTFLMRYQPPELESLIDEDVANAAAALAATYETATRGVIYEHRPATRAAERLVTAMKPLLEEGGQAGGTAFQRDAAVVLRRIETAAQDAMAGSPSSRRAFLDLVGRVLPKEKDDGDSQHLVI